MRAAQLIDVGQIDCEEVEVPHAGAGETLIRMEHAAICGSDLHQIFGGWGPPDFPCPPGYPGHEGVGRVVESYCEEVGEGDRVLAVPHYMAARGFADFQVVRREFLVPLPDDIDPRTSVLAQQYGTVLFALKRFLAAAEDIRTALVIGQGPAGLMFVHRLKQIGFERIIAAEVEESRRAAALRFGADAVIDPGSQSIADTCRELTGQGAELVIEAAGHDECKIDAVQAVAPGGRVGLFGLSGERDDVPFPLHLLYMKQATVFSAHGAQLELGLVSFREAVEEIRGGAFSDGSLFTHQFDIEDIRSATCLANERQPHVLKVDVTFS